jgi:peptidoglycan hydrolase CwlO-like protein
MTKEKKEQIEKMEAVIGRLTVEATQLQKRFKETQEEMQKAYSELEKLKQE